MKRPRVLIIAEAANPEWASVPLVGWCHAQALRQVAEVHLVTQVRNRDAILRAGLREGHDFTAIDSEAVAARLHRIGHFLGSRNGKGWTIGTALGALSYPYFEHLVWKRFHAALRNKQFDLVHRITPLSPTTPSLLAKKLARIDVPFVIGPLNGGWPWPKGFGKERRAEFEWLSYVRGAYRLLPGYRSTRKYAAAILIASRATWEQMPAHYHRKCVRIAENAIDLTRFHKPRTRTTTVPLRAIFVGRLVPCKGLDMLIEAMTPLLKAGQWSLEIVGDGPMKEALQNLVIKREVIDAVRFRGWVKHERVQNLLAKADVFGFPSIREFGGGAVLEAMALGVVPIVVDYGGPGELVTPETGWAVPLGTRDEIIQRLRMTFEMITRDPSLLKERSAAAIARIREQFTWSSKARQVLEVYNRVLGLEVESGEPVRVALPLSESAEVMEPA